ncbi:thioesterase II family protein [Jiella pacifica]|uniref:Alpha/beta fold hydrolase n=1 Tax=Jiella pacifica TaxID=2696469 RepID=A0A6N9T8H8_9HYPH|nr:alpha/beta fold hydrolase [Jiella pacifica]NDW06009.1 alpha/beta fold hydrolase [Jiella pacifica]
MSAALPRRAGQWIVGEEDLANADRILVCFPHAGAGASMYRPWRARMPASTAVLAVQLPGRETRASEPLIDDAREAARAISQAIVTARRGERAWPMAFFGHSLGALVAFETARTLAEEGEPGPHILFAAGRRAPGLALSRPLLHTLDDDDFVAAVRELGGTPPGILEDRRFARFILPMLRSDIAMTDGYVLSPGPDLAARIVTLRADGDILASRAEVEAWADFAPVGQFRCVVFSGDHFFVRHAQQAVIDLVRSEFSPD